MGDSATTSGAPSATSSRETSQPEGRVPSVNVDHAAVCSLAHHPGRARMDTGIRAHCGPVRAQVLERPAQRAAPSESKAAKPLRSGGEAKGYLWADK